MTTEPGELHTVTVIGSKYPTYPFEGLLTVTTAMNTPYVDFIGRSLGAGGGLAVRLRPQRMSQLAAVRVAQDELDRLVTSAPKGPFLGSLVRRILAQMPE